MGGAAVSARETLFQRSLLLRWIHDPDFLDVNPVRVKSLAIVVTVLLFGVEYNRWPAGMRRGAVRALLYMRRGNL